MITTKHLCTVCIKLITKYQIGLNHVDSSTLLTVKLHVKLWVLSHFWIIFWPAFLLLPFKVRNTKAIITCSHSQAHLQHPVIQEPFVEIMQRRLLISYGLQMPCELCSCYLSFKKENNHEIGMKNVKAFWFLIITPILKHIRFVNEPF